MVMNRKVKLIIQLMITNLKKYYVNQKGLQQIGKRIILNCL